MAKIMRNPRKTASHKGRLLAIKWLKILTFSIVFFPSSLLGQENLDSLLHVWNNEQTNDSLRAHAYLSYIYDYYILQQPDSAAYHLQLAYNFCVEKKLQTYRVDTKKIEGYHFFRIGEYSKAIKSYDEGLALAEQIKDSIGIADILLRKGWLYHDNGQKIQAIKNYQKSLNYYKLLNNQSGLGSIYNELGSIYRDEEEWEKSLNYYQLSLKTGLNSKADNVAVIGNIGSLYLVMEQYDTALTLSFEALKFSQDQNDKLGISSSQVIIAAAYKGQGNKEIAIDYYQKALANSEDINDVQRIIECLLALAEFDIENNKNNAAIRKCEACLGKAQLIGDLESMYAGYDCLYQANKAMENGDLALGYFEKMELYEDSLKFRETTKELAQMEFDAKLKEDSILQVEKDLATTKMHQAELATKEKSRNIIFIGGLFFLVIAFGLFLRNRIINSSKDKLQKEKERTESALNKILPSAVAEELKSKGKIVPKNFEGVSVLFTDFKGFTKKSESISPELLLAEINECFDAFDHICEKYAVEKVKTIGDAYMAAGGLADASMVSAKNTVLAGLEMQAFIKERIKEKKGKIPFEMRLGIHTGLVTAGSVGMKKIQYDLWGDTVNTASRMESEGRINQVNISETTFQLIKNETGFNFTNRGEIEVKGKGLMRMYFVERNEST